MDELQRLAAFLYGHAFTSGTLCSIESGDPAGGGGTPPNAPPPAAPAPQPPPALTPPPDVQALADAAAKKAHDAAWADARRHYEAKQAKPGTPSPPPTPAPAATPSNAETDFAALLTRQRSFDRSIGRYQLTDEARDVIEADFALAKPADPAEWVNARAKAFGWGTAGNPAAPANGSTPSQPVNPAVPHGPPVTSRAAAPAPSAPTDDTPIMSMSEADKRALAARIGDPKFAERLLKELARDNVRVRPRLV